MDIQQMVEQNIPIYVINRSARVLGTSHLLVMEFPHPNGGKGSTVKIPAIKYPINLSRRVAPPSAIPLCVSFLDWVNRGVLEIIPPEKAKQILSDPEARAAIKQAYSKLDNRHKSAVASMREKPNFKVRSGGQRETDGIADLSESKLTSRDFYRYTPGEDDLENPPEPQIAAPQGELRTASNTPRAKIVQFCADLKEDPTLKKDFFTDLKSWDEEELTDADLGHLATELKDFDSIASYVRSLMAKRAGGKSDGAARRRSRPTVRPQLETPDEEE